MSALDRRHFLKIGAAGLATGAAAPAFATSAGGAVSGSAVETGHAATGPAFDWSIATFAPLVGSTFAVTRADGITAGTDELTLDGLDDQTRTVGIDGRPLTGETFVLGFASAHALPQGLYDVRHDVLGPFLMALVPAHAGLADGVVMEAVVNTSVPAEVASHAVAAGGVP